MHEPENDPSATPHSPEAAVASGLPESTTEQLGLDQQVAPWWHTIIFVIFLVGLSALGGLSAKPKHFAPFRVPTYIFTIIEEWLLLAFVWWGLRMRRLPLSTLLGERHRGWRGFGRDVTNAAVFWIMAVFVLGIVGLILRAVHIGQAGPSAKVLELAPQTLVQLVLWFFVCFSAGICEELLFRGYMLRQFTSLRGKLWMGIIFSSLIFGCSHGYEGIAGMIQVTIFGILFCLLLLKTKSIRPGMIAHGWFDFFLAIQIFLLRHFHKLQNLHHVH